MTFYKPLIGISFLLTMSFSTVFADNKLPAEFFASNNTKEINLETAYNRLTGPAQTNLQNKMIAVLQQNHMEQGKFEDILGTYRMSSDNKITADNTEHYSASPYQNLSDKQLFSLAKELANVLNQDSVAVFIPNPSAIGDVSVSFTSHLNHINEAVTTIQNKLPEVYNQAYSMRLFNSSAGFNNATVSGIEWLGSKINPAEVKKAFPEGTITYHYGKVYLVYQNGRKEQL